MTSRLFALKPWQVLNFCFPVFFFIFFYFKPFNALSSQEHVVVGLCLWMLGWWLLETIPIFITSLLPLLVLPFFGILSVPKTTAMYFSPAIGLFLGGFLLAAALEKHKLHHLIAQKIPPLFGNQKKQLILGFMCCTAFLSMWISNTAAAMIVLPIALSTCAKDSDRSFSKALLMGVAYSASIGGICTLIGTPANAIFVGFLSQAGIKKITFLNWFMMAFPIAALGLVITWQILTKVFFPVGNAIIDPCYAQSFETVAPTAERKYQIKTVGVFFLMLVFWILSPSLGWKFLSDTHIALAGGVLIIALGLLKIKDLKNIKWSLLILFGGNLALSEGILVSGLSNKFALLGSGLKAYPPLLVLFSIAVAVILCTELLSNTACAAIFIPIGLALEKLFSFPPLTIATVVALSSSLSFMLPMATPPNAILYSVSGFKIMDMVKVGLWINLIFALLITLFSLYWIPIFFLEN